MGAFLLSVRFLSVHFLSGRFLSGRFPFVWAISVWQNGHHRANSPPWHPVRHFSAKKRKKSVIFSSRLLFLRIIRDYRREGQGQKIRITVLLTVTFPYRLYHCGVSFHRLSMLVSQRAFWDLSCLWFCTFRYLWIIPWRIKNSFITFDSWLLFVLFFNFFS